MPRKHRSFNVRRMSNRLFARLTTRFPSLAQRFLDAYDPLERSDTPWHPVQKALSAGTVALITTAGVHHSDQAPFDMDDPNGDPTFRIIDARRPVKDLTITHDYYDHSDADKDINIVFPTERLLELEQNKIIGKAADFHYGFMGHIVGPHISTLIERTAPEVANHLLENGVDMVLLAPG